MGTMVGNKIYSFFKYIYTWYEQKINSERDIFILAQAMLKVKFILKILDKCSWENFPLVESVSGKLAVLHPVFKRKLWSLSKYLWMTAFVDFLNSFRSNFPLSFFPFSTKNTAEHLKHQNKEAYCCKMTRENS